MAEEKPYIAKVEITFLSELEIDATSEEDVKSKLMTAIRNGLDFNKLEYDTSKARIAVGEIKTKE